MGFRTSARTVRIDVNDDGYIVEVPVSDDGWIKRFLDYAERMNTLNEKHMIAAQEDESKSVMEAVMFAQEVKDGFTELFGHGAYEATFGCDIAGVEYVVEFLNYIMPYIEKRVEDRNKILNKYSPYRIGGAR